MDVPSSKKVLRFELTEDSSVDVGVVPLILGVVGITSLSVLFPVLMFLTVPTYVALIVAFGLERVQLVTTETDEDE